MSRALRLFSLLLGAILTLLVSISSPARAEKPPEKAASPPADSWAGQLETVGTWLAKMKAASCTERCFTLSRLRIGGSVGSGRLRFELEGHVLAPGEFAVPLFGAPAHVRIEEATVDGKPASVGFEGDHYYLSTAARHFVLKGALALDDDRALAIPGPLNALEADLADGRCVEGARLSGLANATVHFDRALSKEPSAEPTVFQLSRAIRVGRAIEFEYRLVMRSGADLGVVRLPLVFGERVLDVTGANGFRIDGGDVVLPTSGRAAEIKITGTLTAVSALRPDPRSPYEWWLLESDAEHRITANGDARQLDSAESPIPRTLPTARLYMAQRGQHLDVAVQTLSSVDVLAAVIRGHRRTVVLTRVGDLVSDETLQYENNGIDYLFLAPDGKPIYLATDGKAERIMHREKEATDVMVPLRTGSHGLRMQSLARVALAPFLGRVEIPLATYPLTASRVDLRLGLPASVYPLALLGGERAHWFVDGGDLVALAIAAASSLLAFRGKLRRALGALVAGGLWFLAPPLFVAVIGLLFAVGLTWILGRFLEGRKLTLAIVGVVLLGGFTLMLVVAGSAARENARAPSADGYEGGLSNGATAFPAAPATEGRRDAVDKTGNFMAQGAVGGVLEGVTPVALELPAAQRWVEATRELVTRERPFRPELFYVTQWAVAPALLVWLACLIALIRLHAVELAGAWARARGRLARGPARKEP